MRISRRHIEGTLEAIHLHVTASLTLFNMHSSVGGGTKSVKRTSTLPKIKKSRLHRPRHPDNKPSLPLGTCTLYSEDAEI